MFNFIGIPFALDTFTLKKQNKRRKCQRSFEDSQRDALVKTDAKFLGYTVFFIKGLKEGRPCKSGGRRKKEEMIGLESANGQV